MPVLRRTDGPRRRDGAAAGILVAVYRDHVQVQRALEKLDHSNSDLRRVCVVGTDYHVRENVWGHYATGRTFQAWGELGCFWGGVWAVLTGAGVFFLPRLGEVVMAGPVVGWLVETLEKGVMVKGLTVLGAALVGRGVPADSMLDYEADLRGDKFLLMIAGATTELAKARSLIALTRGRISVHAE
jgi:hypothetical protein